ncbi:MAG: NAD(+)/NADH kinase, partial [Candidatus Dormibacteria bacterium]
MTAPRSLGFLIHPGEEDLVRAGVQRAEACGFEVWTAVQGPEPAVNEHGEDTALLITVGGDGTFLYGARLAGPRGIPVLGINRGRLGFLTDVLITDLPGAIEAFAAGQFTTERRTMISVVAEGPGQDDPLLMDVV